MTLRPSSMRFPGAPSSYGAARAPSNGERLPPQELAIDDHLVVAETPFEVVDGQLVETMGANPPHAMANSRLAFVLEAVVREGYACATDMLTRADRYSDFAPDASVFPTAIDPETGGRQLDRIAFEIRDTQSAASVQRKAALLSDRGVARVLCIDVAQTRVLEWSREDREWRLLDDSAEIVDEQSLTRGIPVRALLSSAAAEESVARALLAKNRGPIAEALEARERGGEARGEARGEVKGERAGLIEAIDAATTLLGLSVTDAQRAAVTSLDPAGLRALLHTLVATRAWPESA